MNDDKMPVKTIDDVLELLTPQQIGAAYARAGYMEMTPRACEFDWYEKRNNSYVYTCEWVDTVNGVLVKGHAYVTVKNGFVVAES